MTIDYLLTLRLIDQRNYCEFASLLCALRRCSYNLEKNSISEFYFLKSYNKMYLIKCGIVKTVSLDSLQT